MLGSHHKTFRRIFAIENEIDDQDQLGASLRRDVADAMAKEAEQHYSSQPVMRNQDVPLGFKWRLLGPDAPRTNLGRQWEAVGPQIPTVGTEFKDDALSYLLLEKANAFVPLMLSANEWLEWKDKLKGLQSSQFVKAVTPGQHAAAYFKPIAASSEIRSFPLEAALREAVLHETCKRKKKEMKKRKSADLDEESAPTRPEWMRYVTPTSKMCHPMVEVPAAKWPNGAFKCDECHRTFEVDVIAPEDNGWSLFEGAEGNSKARCFRCKVSNYTTCGMSTCLALRVELNKHAFKSFMALGLEWQARARHDTRLDHTMHPPL